MSRVPTPEELEGLSTEELRERAFRVARRRLDVLFFWNLLEMAPAAEAAPGTGTRPTRTSSASRSASPTW